MADMLALTFDAAHTDWDASTGMVLEHVPRPTLSSGQDRSCVIVKVRFAGFCGTDRGIWWRKAMGDMVLGSLKGEGGTKRVFGHEMLGEIVEVGDKAATKYGYAPGDVVSTESHIVCGACYQCRRGEQHVCANEKIIGVSMDGCFAEYVKLPAKALWRTDTSRIRPEIAAVQEPFGNAVHACQVTDLRGQSVAILGTGTIGLFAVLVAKGMGARQVIGIEPDAGRRAQALQLGADHVFAPAMPDRQRPHAPDPELRGAIEAVTDGVGVDVAMEMSGFNSSLNSAIQITRRGGHVVLFGLKNGDAVITDFHRVIMNGLQLHGVVGRRIFQTWEMTRGLLENTSNGIQQAIWEVILNGGDQAIVDLQGFEPVAFEGVMERFTKPVIRVA
ncbi:MAG: zinc-binding dehydrogenase [Myxococcales bacterium]|nr:zinc-binding dehydrogenase [Myxococcales bacterium]